MVLIANCVLCCILCSILLYYLEFESFLLASSVYGCLSRIIVFEPLSAGLIMI